jgi:hypothetical protein
MMRRPAVRAATVAFALLCCASSILAGARVAPAAAPAASPSPLPEIGRTRSVVPACAVIRDLVAPSLGAALDADAAFRDARAQIAAANAGGGFESREAQRTLGLIRLGKNVGTMAKDVLTINRALGDPRVAKTPDDPATRELREALQALYEAQNAKLNALSGFVEGQRMAQLRADDETIRQMAAANSPGNVGPHPQPTALASGMLAAPADIVEPRDPAHDTNEVERLERKAAAAIIEAANVCRPAKR